MVCLLSNSYAFSNLSGVCCRGVVHFNIYRSFIDFFNIFYFRFVCFFILLLPIRILLWCVSSRSDLRHGTSWRMAQPACSWDFVCGRLSSWVHPLYTIGIIVFLLYLFFHSWRWLECTCQLLWRWKKVLHHVFKKTIYSIGIIIFLLYLSFHFWWWLECTTCQFKSEEGNTYKTIYSIGIIIFLLYLPFHYWWWLECN